MSINKSRFLIIIILLITITGCKKEDKTLPDDEVIVYAQLAKDPTSEAVISWIAKEREGYDIIEYKEIDENIYSKKKANIKTIPEKEDLRLYTAKLEDLSPESWYHFRIAGQNIKRKFQTLPSRLPSEGINVGIAGDAHYKSKGHDLHDELTRAMRDNNIRILVGSGDYVDCEGELGVEQTRSWIDFLNMLDQNLNQKDGSYNYIPLAFVIGNHETTPNFGGEPEDASYLRFFLKYPNKLEPKGKNYGSIQIGDYLQLMMMDAGHTSNPGDEQREWLSATVDESIKHCVPVMHASPFPSVRDPLDSRYESLRLAWMDVFYNKLNIRVAFDSHDHGWKRTVPLGLVKNKPDHGNNEAEKGYFSLNNKYITEKDNGVVFFGEGGWGSTSRRRWNPATTWYIEDVQDRMSNYKRGYSGVEHKNDGKQAGEYWEHVYITNFKSDAIIVNSVNPSGEVFYNHKIDLQEKHVANDMIILN